MGWGELEWGRVDGTGLDRIGRDWDEISCSSMWSDTIAESGGGGLGARSHLAKIHHNGLVDLLPQVGSEDLDEGNLERGDLAVHEDPSEVELHLEADVDVSAVDRRRPPKGETPIGDLVETRSLGIGELFVLHRLLEARGFLPEKALPRGEVAVGWDRGLGWRIVLLVV